MKNNFTSFNKKILNKKKKIKKNYLGHTSKTFGIKQLSFYKYRLQNIRLTWCQQVLEIIEKLNFLNPKINDLGCNYFQLFKEIKYKKFRCDYYGYDIDQNFVNLGLDKYPELKKKHKIINIENAALRNTDISIISDTLEVTEKPEKILKNIVSSTKKVIILRTFLANEERIQLANSKILEVPYFINCFSYNMIIEFFIKNNFYPQIYPDLATNSSQLNEIFPGIKRRFFIIVLIKKNFLLKNFKTKIHNKLYVNK